MVVDIGTIISNLKYVVSVLTGLAWLAAIIGYMTGLLKIGLPIPSRKLKASGHEDIETSSLAVFFILFFSTFVAIISWLLEEPIPKP